MPCAGNGVNRQMPRQWSRASKVSYLDQGIWYMLASYLRLIKRIWREPIRSQGHLKKYNWSQHINKCNIHDGNLRSYDKHLCSLFPPDKRILAPKDQIRDLVPWLCTLVEPMQIYLRNSSTVCLRWTKLFFLLFSFFMPDLAWCWKVWVIAFYCPKMSP